jgi:hypothetical protein
LAAAVAVVPAAVIWIANVPAVPEASKVPEVDDMNTVATGVRVGLVNRVVPPDVEIAVVASVATLALVVLISAEPLVAPVGVCEGLAIMASVLVPVPAESTQGILHCHAQAFAIAGSDHVQIVIGVLTVRVMSAVTRQELALLNSPVSSFAFAVVPTPTTPAVMRLTLLSTVTVPLTLFELFHI